MPCTSLCHHTHTHKMWKTNLSMRRWQRNKKKKITICIVLWELTYFYVRNNRMDETKRTNERKKQMLRYKQQKYTGRITESCGNAEYIHIWRIKYACMVHRKITKLLYGFPLLTWFHFKYYVHTLLCVRMNKWMNECVRLHVCMYVYF